MLQTIAAEVASQNVGQNLEQIVNYDPLTQTPPAQKIEICSITGVVKSVKFERNNPTSVIRIRSIETSAEYNIECSYFCPVRSGDVITGYCCAKTSGTYTFIREPVAEPASSEDEIKRAFYIALYKQKPSQSLINKLYKFFEKETLQRIDQKDNLFYRNRDSISTATLELISHYAFRFRFDESVIEPLMTTGLSKNQSEMLLRWWYRSHTLRRLYLLGLTKKIIRACTERGYSPADLYYKLLENPYTVETVPIDIAQKIAIRYGLPFGNDILECAQIIRFADKLITELKWSCCPIYRLTKLPDFPNLLKYQDILKTQFNCRIRYNCLYLEYLAKTENILTEYLDPDPVDPIIVDDCYVTNKTKTRLFPEQLKAVKMALTHNVSIITGRGGTGKTTVISAIIDELELRNIKYFIVSYTGKAVSRIKEIVLNSEKIKTLHMLTTSKLPPGTGYLIVDEASMVPNHLMARVLERFSDIKIVFVGDPGQVQPIDCGDLFNQILQANNIPTTRLLVDRRRDKDSILRTNMNILADPSASRPVVYDEDGCPDDDDSRFLWGDDCQFIKGDTPEIESLIKSFASQGINPDNLVIISPYNRNLDQFNECCKESFLCKTDPEIKDEWGIKWKLNSRVMLTVNRYDIMVMNGEEGKITKIVDNHKLVEVTFTNGKKVEFPTYTLLKEKQIRPELESGDDDETGEPLSTHLLILSYAITIHKSQGSEWPIVVFFLPSGNRGSFVNKNLIYTAISRAKSQLYVVSYSKEELDKGLSVLPPRRFDNLARRIRKTPYSEVYQA